MVGSPPATYPGRMASRSAPTRGTQRPVQVADRPAVPARLGFRGFRPSPLGWVAVLAPGAVAGLVIAATAERTGIGRLVGAAAAGAVAGMALARVVDEIHWRRSAVCIELAEPDAVLDLLQAVRAQGVHADMIRAPDAPDGTRHGYALRYRARDDRRVRAVLAGQLG